MIYVLLVLYLCALSSVIKINEIDKYKYQIIVFLSMICVVLTIIPSIQQGIGSDYFSYYEDYLEKGNRYLINGEVAFYYLIYILNEFNLDAQYLFLLSALICNVLVVIIFYKLYSINVIRSLTVFMFVFLVYSNMYHNQMNIIRTYIAVYFFILSFIFKFERKIFLSFLLIFIGSLFHKLVLLFVPFIILPIGSYQYLYKNIKYLYVFILLSIIISPLLFSSIEYITMMFFREYSTYLTSVYAEGSIKLINILTRVYYIPAFLLLYHLINSKKIKLNIICQSFVVMSIFHQLFIIVIIFNPLLARLGHFFVFFSAISLIFLYNYFSSKLKLIFILYLLFPYILKVVFFPSNEFVFNTIL